MQEWVNAEIRAELLRRSNLARRQASRSVAGPAPPPSWRSRPAAIASSSKSASMDTSSSWSSTRQPVTSAQLSDSSEIFHHPLLFEGSTASHNNLQKTRKHERGVASLTEYCLRTVLAYLENEEEVDIWDNGDPDVEGGGIASRGGMMTTVGAIFREQTSSFDTHLKSRMLDIASIMPESSTSRLSDRSLQAILSLPPAGDLSHDTGWTDVDDTHADLALCSLEDDEDTDWEATDMTSDRTRLINHLPLTLHSAPPQFLRSLPNLSALSLTSLNLAYSTIPYDLDRLVAVLPSGLRALSLCGVRFGRVQNGRQVDQIAWEQRVVGSFTKLARKLVVLKVSLTPHQHQLVRFLTGPAGLLAETDMLTCTADARSIMLPFPHLHTPPQRTIPAPR